MRFVTQARLAASLAASLAVSFASAIAGAQGTCRPTLRGDAVARNIVIENATVIPMDADRTPSVQTVVIRGGTIASVSTRAIAPNGVSFAHVDAQGCFLIPGLIDMHVHLYDTESLPSYLRHGVTTIVNLNGYESLLELRTALSGGRIVGPSLFTAGPSIDGDPALNITFASVADTAAARAEVRGQKESGYDFIKVYSRLQPAEYRAILDEAHRLGIAVFGHAPFAVGIDSVVSSSQANIAHVEEFFQNPVDDAHFPALVAAAKRSHTTVTPNLVAYSDYLRSIDNLAAVLAEPEMRFASPAGFNEKSPANNRSIRPNPAAFAQLLRTRQVRFRVLTKMLNDAGVPLFLGTDTEIFGLAGQAEQLELRELVASGLTNYQALRAATAAAGAFLAARTPTPLRGVIALGARADIVLLAANPLVNAANADSVRAVLVGGRWLPADRLDQMRDSIVRFDAPVRAAAKQFDSLMSAGNFVAAVRVIDESHRTHPFVPPLAQAVIPRYARRALQRGDTAAAIAVERLQSLLYPNSGASYRELARLELTKGDSAAARGHLVQSLKLAPNHAWARATAASLGAKH